MKNNSLITLHCSESLRKEEQKEIALQKEIESLSIQKLRKRIQKELSKRNATNLKSFFTSSKKEKLKIILFKLINLCEDHFEKFGLRYQELLEKDNKARFSL